MAFQQPAIYRHPQRISAQSQESTSVHQRTPGHIEQSQEWVLFAPSHTESTTNRTRTTKTAGLSRVSDLGSWNSAARSAQPHSSVLDEEATEDGELDSLDDGLQAFREPVIYKSNFNQIETPVLPTHDGLGTFPASSPLVLEQLWRHEQHNPKRKHEGGHRRPSSVQQKLDTVEELEAQANEEKRIRIEKWRMDQSQAFLEEVERETRHQMRKVSLHQRKSGNADLLGTTPKQSDFVSASQEDFENEPFWRKVTRKFIRDVIGIDDPLLSVILGESLPGESTPRPSTPVDSGVQDEETVDQPPRDSWRNRLLQRIARELGVFVHQISPHPGAFSTYTNNSVHDYAGIPIKAQPAKPTENMSASNRVRSQPFSSALTPNFPPTLRATTHAESWGFEDEPQGATNNTVLNLQQEREYWERELDVKMVFRYLANKFVTRNQGDESAPPSEAQNDASATRVAIIRQHHPLIARAHRSPVRTRRESRIVRRATSSCASESAKGGPRPGVLRSGSSRNYWDIGGSVGSGSLVASGGHLGAWGEA